MSVLFGHGAFIKFGEETSWGTGVTPTISNRINSITMSKTQERDRKANLSVPASGMLGEVFDGFLIAEGSMGNSYLLPRSRSLVQVSIWKGHNNWWWSLHSQL